MVFQFKTLLLLGRYGGTHSWAFSKLKELTITSFSKVNGGKHQKLTAVNVET
jgi:hypothetical protein